MKILFVDQSGQLGGAELCLLDLTKFYGDSCCVALLEDGPFYQRLQQADIPAVVLQQNGLVVRKQSSILQGLAQLPRLAILVQRLLNLASDYDVIYANTPKALVVAAIVSRLLRKPLVYHLHDIIDDSHFSAFNRTLLVNLANSCVRCVIANSEASKAAFLKAGGQLDQIPVIYNGFNLTEYAATPQLAQQLRQTVAPDAQFLVGHFSRLSPWKGQHILLQALAHPTCPPHVQAVFVGDALFGESEYVQQLHSMVEALKLESRVHFLGFRSDIVPLMQACDFIAHTSTAPEPLGRVIVEAMLNQRAVVAAAAGGAVELIDNGVTGWLSVPGDVEALAQKIQQCVDQPDIRQNIVSAAYQSAMDRFELNDINYSIDTVIKQMLV